MARENPAPMLENSWIARSRLAAVCVAPERLPGLTGGMFNFVGNLASVGVPIVIGQLVKGGDFAPAITFIAATAGAGAICYGLVVGKVQRIHA